MHCQLNPAARSKRQFADDRVETAELRPPEEETMSSMRREARRRGVRMAARIAVVTGFVAAGAAYGNAAESAPSASDEARADAPGSDDRGLADQVTEALRARSVKKCGCMPCWGPPPPPAMLPELFELFPEAQA
jgi:hypothetical protein